MTAILLEGISRSFPPLDQGAIAPAEWNRFLSLPDDYRGLLLAHNGGFLEDERYTFSTGVPYRTETVDNPSRTDWPLEFYGIPTTSEPGRWPEDLFRLAEEHASEEFLPSNVIAIARCSQNSLVCLSVAGGDRGAVYYWDWYWQYPWCESFFRERITEAKRRLPDYSAALRDPSHPRYRETMDALNAATVVRLADSLPAWLAGCEDQRRQGG